MMRNRTIWIGLAIAAAVIVLIVALTAALTPQQTHPAYAAALAFADAAGKGDDDAAFALLAPPLQDYVTANCPDGSISACVDAYTPPEWGGFQSIVFRRAVPDSSTNENGTGVTAYDVDLIGTWAQDKGFSGVCVYTRVEQNDSGAWLVTRYAGWVSCGDAESRDMARNPDAPNRAP